MARNRSQHQAINHAADVPSNAAPNGAPSTEARIAERAYERWMSRGCPAGDDLRDWFEAQAELQARGGAAASAKT